MSRARGLCVLCLCVCLLLPSGCARQEKRSVTLLAMDTVMELTAYGGQDDALEQAQELLLSLDEQLSVTGEDSEIYAINRDGAGTVSPDTAGLLAQALELCRRTGRALDLSVYPVLRRWGFTTGEYEVPDRESLEELLPLVDYTQVKVDRETGAVTLGEGMQIDLGSVAKGYAGDRVAALLAGAGVRHALLELGGNIQTVGTRPDGSPWRVAIRDPESEGYVGVVTVAGQAVVTSGGYERFFEQDGQIYWHIIDPATGEPARSGLLSVTVVGESGLYCDALSTALFVMGPDKALDYWRANRDFEAVLIGQDGSVTVTAGLAENFTLSQTERELVVVEE